MLAFPVERATYRSERPGQRKDVGGDEQIGILGAYRMPIDTFSGDRYFRHQVRACKCYARRREATQCNAADHPVLLGDLLGIHEAAELLGLRLTGHCPRQSNPKPLRSRPPAALPCPPPR